MSNVMDLKHILCHPCEPCLPMKIDVPTTRLEPMAYEWRYDSSITQTGPPYAILPSQSPVSTCSTRSSSSSGSGHSSYTSDGSASPPHPSFLESYESKSPRQSVAHAPRRRTASEQAGPSTSTSQRRPRSASTGQVQTRTPWTPVEDDLLVQGFDRGLSWAMISSHYLPHRSRGCCWGRYKTLQARNLVDAKPSTRTLKRSWKTVAHKAFQ